MKAPVPRNILLITRNFPPVWGGMERLNWHVADTLAQRCAVQVLAPMGAADSGLPAAVAVTEVPLSPLSRCLPAMAWHSLRIARRWRPEVILAGSGLTAPIAWLAARACGARCAVYAHGLDLTVPHPVYRAVWLPVLRRMDGLIANSAATARLAQTAGVRPDRIGIVHPGVTLPAPDPNARNRFRAAHGWGLDQPLLLSVGRLTTRKGLKEFVSEVLPQIVAQHPNVCLVVVGDVPKAALYAHGQTPEAIQAAADVAGVGRHIRFLSTLFGAELDAAYTSADLHVFPVRSLPNDPEGFGMVAVEAAAHGLPTVAYAVGGVVDAVADGVSGRLVAAGDSRAFADAVLALLAAPLPSAAVTAFAARFSWPLFGERLYDQLPFTIAPHSAL